MIHVANNATAPDREKSRGLDGKYYIKGVCS